MLRSFVVLVVVGFSALIAVEEANAYYHPQMGRFVNRDPAGQLRFSNRIGSAQSTTTSTRGAFITHNPATINSSQDNVSYEKTEFVSYQEDRMQRFSNFSQDTEVEISPISRFLPMKPHSSLSPMRDFIYLPMTQYDDGMNLYQYVEGSPVARVDPSGLKWASCMIAAACLARQEAACAAACRWDPIWDDRRDTWRTCFLKCRKAKLQGILKNVSDAGCYAAVYSCGARAINEWAKKAGPSQLPKPVMEQGPQGPLAPLKCAVK